MNTFQPLFDVHVVSFYSDESEHAHQGDGCTCFFFSFLKLKLWLNIGHYRKRAHSLFFKADCLSVIKSFTVINAEHAINNNP